MHQLPAGTSLKDLSIDTDIKIHALQNASILDQAYDKLRNEIKSLSTQNLSFQARDKQVSDELRSLRESAIVKENQIATLIQEKEFFPLLHKDEKILPLSKADFNPMLIKNGQNHN